MSSSTIGAGSSPQIFIAILYHGPARGLASGPIARHGCDLHRGVFVDKLKPWFDFHGRLSRIGYWRAFLRLSIASGLVWLLGLAASLAVGGWAAPIFLLFVPLLIANIAVTVQRFHDRGRPIAWGLFLVLLPSILIDGAQAGGLMKMIGGLAYAAIVLVALAVDVWLIVELYFMGSSPRGDRYGPARA